MDDLQTIKVGGLTKDSDTSSPVQISAYVNSALSAQTVALGGGTPDINTKAKDKGVVIGYNAETEDNNSVVVVGATAKAKDYGTAIGYQAYSNLGVAFGADACALSGHSVALGRYSCVSAEHAVQINGADKINEGKDYDPRSINKEKGTLKFWNGTKNITIVKTDGTISADNAYAATKLQTSHKIGGTAFDGTADINLSATSATTAGTADTALAVTINGTKYNLGTATVKDTAGNDKTVLTLSQA